MVDSFGHSACALARLEEDAAFGRVHGWRASFSLLTGAVSGRILRGIAHSCSPEDGTVCWTTKRSASTDRPPSIRRFPELVREYAKDVRLLSMTIAFRENHRMPRMGIEP